MKCTGDLVIGHSDLETLYLPLEIIYYTSEYSILTKSNNFGQCSISTISSR